MRRVPCPGSKLEIVTDDSNDETLRTETAPDPRRLPREMSTFKAPAQRFTLGDELGRGGMGQVIAARDVSLKRGVAIKKVLSTNEVDLERFDREVRITAELEHPSIVPIHDVGIDDDGRPFYVMRQIRGEPLSARLAALPTLRARLALVPTLLAVADAAAFAHARRILHRDIKPANILIGSFGETLLIDWGLARREGEIEPRVPEAADSLPAGALTVAGYVYGTPGYMAPEQARGEIVDARADVFALGATLFHLLAGQGPYEGMSAGDRMQAAIDEVPAPFERLPLDAPSELRAITIKAMAVDPAQRYANAGELAADLRAFLEGQLVGAHHYTLGERVRRFVRRHRAALAVALLAVVALAVVGVIAVLRVIDETSQAEVAELRTKDAIAAFVDREQELIVKEASSTVDVDPVRAILYLRELPLDSRHLGHARDVAARAAARGLPHGDRAHVQRILALSLSPDLRHLASGDVSGRVAVRDLATRAPRVLAELDHRVLQLDWVDATTLLSMAKRGIARFTLPAGTHDLLARDHEISWFAVADPPDRVRFVDANTHELYELPFATGEARVVARDVEIAVGRGESLAISGRGGVRWWTPERELLLTPVRAAINLNMAVSPQGDQLALATGDQVFVWDQAGIERGRWTVKFSLQPFFTSSVPHVVTYGGKVVRLDAESKEFGVSREPVIGIVQSSVGTGAVFESGALLMATSGSRMRDVPLRMAQASAVAARTDSELIAIGSRTGEVAWWDLAAVAPAPIHVGRNVPCTLDDREVFVLKESTSLIAVDRKTLAVREVAQFSHLGAAVCLGVTSHRQIVIAVPGIGGHLVDGRTGALRSLARGLVSFDLDNDAVLFSEGKTLFELAHGTGDRYPLFEAPDVLDSVDTRKRWILARLQDGRLLRFDRQTRQVVEVTQWRGTEMITDDGDVWYSTDRWLWRWTDRGRMPIGEFAVRIERLGGNGAPTLVRLVDRTQWTATIDRRIRQITSPGTSLWIGRRAYALYTWAGKVAIHSLLHDERIEWELADSTSSGRLERDEHTALLRIGGEYLGIFVDKVPEDPKAFTTWLDGATNAELDPATKVVRWRATASPETPHAP